MKLVLEILNTVTDRVLAYQPPVKKAKLEKLQSSNRCKTARGSTEKLMVVFPVKRAKQLSSARGKK